MKTLLVLSGFVLLSVAGCVVRPPPLRVTALRCELDADPLGVDVAQPRLGWLLESPERNQVQSAFQVLAASAPDVLARNQGDLWDSGRMASDETTGVLYRGRPLASAQRVFWKVRVWDGHGRGSAWSPVAQWTMGLLAAGPAVPGGSGAASWQAHWITDPDLFRWQRPVFGYHSKETTDPATTKWVQLDLGASRLIAEVRLHSLRYSVIEGLGFPRKFKVEVSDDPTFVRGTVVADFSQQEYPNPWVRRLDLPVAGVTGRYVRLTANGLRVEEGRACLALSQVEVISGGVNVAVGAAVTASDSWERGPWSARALTDGLGVPGTNPRANATLLLRRGFVVRPGLRRALIFVCGLGEYELAVNGARAGDSGLAPGWTDFEKTCLYDSIDVTPLVHAGANAVGLALAGGMYNVQEGRYVKFITPFRPLTAIAEIRLEYADGAVEYVITDDQWSVAPGPVTFANMYGGEDYDARREPRGWDQAGFDDSSWRAAAAWAGPGGALRGHSYAAPAIGRFEVLHPVVSHLLRPGVTVYDLGQNAALMLRLKVRGPAGATVRVIPAELLAPDGAVDRGSCGARGPAWWQYTLAGGGGETWAPDFFYHGCRYLQVECSPPDGGATPAPSPVEGPVVESLEGVVVQAAAPPVGEFACSNELFNRIHLLVRWAQRSNMMSVMTDCPHRERLGWLEEDHLNGPALRYEFDLARLLAKTVNDMADAQQPDGLVPSIAPEYVIFTDGFRDSPEWGSACVLIPWQQYEWTGDVALLRRSYDMMKRYLVHLGSRADHHLVDFGLGDWYDIGPGRPGIAQLTPIALTATAFYYDDARIVARVAELLGRPDEARQYQELAAQIRTAFNQAFFDPAKDRYATGSQCAEAIPLVMDLADPARRPAVLAALVKDVRDRGNALTAGDVGYRYLLRALADGGHSDVIYDMNNQSEKPGYGYQLKRGATSLTEAWDADPRASQNHFMLGQINEWFYHDLAGIQGDRAGPGFKRIIIRPAVVGGLTWVKASFDSVRGRIASEWHRDGTQLTLQVTIPPNTTATVHVPAPDPAAVLESGRRATRSAGISFLRMEDGAAVFAVGSGVYIFTTTMPAR
jgi:hypothetical protein